MDSNSHIVIHTHTQSYTVTYTYTGMPAHRIQRVWYMERNKQNRGDRGRWQRQDTHNYKCTHMHTRMCTHGHMSKAFHMHQKYHFKQRLTNWWWWAMAKGMIYLTFVWENLFEQKSSNSDKKNLTFYRIFHISTSLWTKMEANGYLFGPCMQATIYWCASFKKVWKKNGKNEEKGHFRHLEAPLRLI